ncbi:MAG: SDR family NAD(P)-dependent oxidoreductase [Bacteroidota bacterium]
MKKIILTGGHSGMGLELSKKLLSENHQIGLIVRSDKRKIETERLFQTTDKVDIFIADLSKRDNIKTVVKQIQSAWGQLDGIFNNAGVLLDKLYLSDYGNEMQLEVNAIGPYLLTKGLLPLMVYSEKPFVVNTATAGLDRKKRVNVPEFKSPKKFKKLTGSYMDSKLALMLMMNKLGEQYNKVRFVNVNPGAIKTKMTAGSGMPSFLKPIRNIFFKSPEYGANNLYTAAFDTKFARNGTYISNGKIKNFALKLSDNELEQILENS